MDRWDFLGPAPPEPKPKIPPVKAIPPLQEFGYVQAYVPEGMTTSVGEPVYWGTSTDMAGVAIEVKEDLVTFGIADRTLLAVLKEVPMRLERSYDNMLRIMLR